MSNNYKEFGWANYETWAVKLWVQNDESSYRYWEDVAASIAARIYENDLVIDNIAEPDRAAVIQLAELMREEYVDGMPAMNGVYVDLLNSALQSVDWDSIAASILENHPIEPVAV